MKIKHLNESAELVENQEVDLTISYDDLYVCFPGRQRDVDVFDADKERTIDYDYEPDKGSVIEEIIDYLFEEDDSFYDKSEEELDKYVEDNLEKLFNKYYEKLKEYFRDDAAEDALDKIDVDEYDDDRRDWDAMPGGHDWYDESLNETLEKGDSNIEEGYSWIKDGDRFSIDTGNGLEHYIVVTTYDKEDEKQLNKYERYIQVAKEDSDGKFTNHEDREYKELADLHNSGKLVFEAKSIKTFGAKAKRLNEGNDYKVKFFQVFEAPKSPTENGKMIGQRGTLDDANAFGKEKVGEGNYIIKAVCDDGQTRPIDNDTDASAYKLAESNDVQYGVHQFSTESIIFRGTEEECGKYIDSHKELWDDAEVYRMTPEDPHYLHEKKLEPLTNDNFAKINDPFKASMSDIKENEATVQRYLDIEIPDICREVLELIPNCTNNQLEILKTAAQRFYSNLEFIASQHSSKNESLGKLTLSESLFDDAVLTEDVDVETKGGPEVGPEYGLASLLNEAIQDEFKTIDMYNSIALTAKDEGFEDIVSVIDEINTEENKHVGQLQEILKTVSPNAEAIDAGEVEGEEQLKEGISHDKAAELAELLKDPLQLDDYGAETFEHDMNNLRGDEWIDSVKRLPNGTKGKAEFLAIFDTLDDEEFDESINNSNSSPNNNIEEEKGEHEMTTRAEQIYQSFKEIEKELNGDGEAITAVIDKLYDDNREDPDYKAAWTRWADGE